MICPVASTLRLAIGDLLAFPIVLDAVAVGSNLVSIVAGYHFRVCGDVSDPVVRRGQPLGDDMGSVGVGVDAFISELTAVLIVRAVFEQGLGGQLIARHSCWSVDTTPNCRGCRTPRRSSFPCESVRWRR